MIIDIINNRYKDFLHDYDFYDSFDFNQLLEYAHDFHYEYLETSLKKGNNKTIQKALCRYLHENIEHYLDRYIAKAIKKGVSIEILEKFIKSVKWKF